MSTPLRLALLLTAVAGCGDDPKPSAPPADPITDPIADPPADTDPAPDTDRVEPPVPPEPPAPLEAWERDEVRSPGPITFNELQYNAGPGDDLTWIELHNPMAFDVDLSGWRIEGGAGWTFADGVTIAAGGFLVVASDPARVAGALGPLTGSLDRGGERLDLRSNSGRRIDSVAYDDEDPWPEPSDGSGLTLAKVKADAASDRPESWSVSAGLGGTPGRANQLDPTAPPIEVVLVPIDSPWAYDDAGAYPAADWALVGFNDLAWPRGEATFFAGPAAQDSAAVVRVTADNFYGLYLGASDGTGLRVVGADPDGDWTTVESFDVWAGAEDHLFMAAWESPGDVGGPQMAIAEVELPSGVTGSSVARWSWTLGPALAAPGAAPFDPEPPVAEVAGVIQQADAAGGWAPPAVEADPSAGPWGWAVGAWFAADTRYVWPDTFGDLSWTNTNETYALFRTVDPVLGARGRTEIPDVPTTTIFRASFRFEDDPAATELWLEHLVDDGAVFYLNGVEVLRVNMPAGAVDASTPAASAVGDAATGWASIPAAALVRGDNVLSAEVHQAEPAGAPDPDLTFAAALTARVSPVRAAPAVGLNEVAAADGGGLWVELVGQATTPTAPGDLRVVSTGGGEQLVPARTFGPGELVRVDLPSLTAAPGDLIVVYDADRTRVFDAARVADRPRGRADGPWRTPSEPTPGAPNRFVIPSDVVIHELQYHHAPRSVDGQPAEDVDLEWVELYNRGQAPVDLSGWQLVDAVAFTFPAGVALPPDGYLVVTGDLAAFQAAYPGVPALGVWSGRLDNRSDRLLLRDPNGNPADEVRYHDGGRWPAAADGGGATLELRDPRADNAAPEAWVASDEGARSAWTRYTWRGVATPSAVGPDGQWEEWVLGLLDAGEVLIDDLRVVEDPAGAAREVLTNGSFDRGRVDGWRLLGNHRHSEVVPDPDDPGNPVLRLVATGPTGHMHNHAETTLRRPIREVEYEVSLRARWVSGSNQLNTRLYFNRLPRTIRVDRPANHGTPGAPNTASVPNLGPTFGALRQHIVAPVAFEPVPVGVTVADPDGVDAVTLWTAVDGGAFGASSMVEVEPGRWEGVVDGAPEGTIVQLYVEAVDGLGAASTLPASGPTSRALIQFGRPDPGPAGLHDVRILMTAADADWLHDEVNLMSDDAVGATVIYDGSEVYYDVGVRAKGSQRGRPEQPRLGFGLVFPSDQPFRGRHTSALVDRSEGVGFGQREVLMNLVMARAGAFGAEFNDLTWVRTPRPEHTGPAELQLDRLTNLVLDAELPDGADGTVFEYELVYYPYTTDDGTPEGLKLPQPDNVIGTSITWLGSDHEAWRWNFLIQNNEHRDDYSRILALGDAFSLSGPDFLRAADAVIDVDAWLRSFAFATVAGAVDNYGGDGAQHNARLYVRPDDQRVVYVPHDLDFMGWYGMPVVGNGDLARLLASPLHRRAYYGHLADILQTAYNPDYLAPWCAQLGALLAPQDFAGHCRFVADRAGWLLRDAPDAVFRAFPQVDFAITSRGGQDFTVSTPGVTLEGRAWVDVREITLAGAPLAITWVDETTWRVDVPLAAGPNAVELVAVDRWGAAVGVDTVVVTVVP